MFVIKLPIPICDVASITVYLSDYRSLSMVKFSYFFPQLSVFVLWFLTYVYKEEEEEEEEETI